MHLIYFNTHLYSYIICIYSIYIYKYQIYILSLINRHSFSQISHTSCGSCRTNDANKNIPDTISRTCSEEMEKYANVCYHYVMLFNDGVSFYIGLCLYTLPIVAGLPETGATK